MPSITTKLSSMPADVQTSCSWPLMLRLSSRTTGIGFGYGSPSIVILAVPVPSPLSVIATSLLPTSMAPMDVVEEFLRELEYDPLETLDSFRNMLTKWSSEVIVNGSFDLSTDRVASLYYYITNMVSVFRFRRTGFVKWLLASSLAMCNEAIPEIMDELYDIVRGSGIGKQINVVVISFDFTN